MTLPASPKIEMGWLHPQDGDRTFVLQSEGRSIGNLQFEDEPAARSPAELHGRSWTFERTGAYRHRILVRAAASEAPVAEFTPLLAGGGVVVFADGRKFHWTREHIWSARWCFRSRQQKSAVCISQQVGAVMSGCKVAVCSDAVEREETPVLILLAWYLRILETLELSESVLVCA